MAKTSGNKMKKWRKESPGDHKGRRMKFVNAQFDSREKPAASGLIFDLFTRAGIRMPKAEAFMQALKDFVPPVAATATPVTSE